MRVPDFSHESTCPAPVCGIDEAGRGPWAGPVVAAAVILDPARLPKGLNDSKQLTAEKRESLLGALRDCAHIGVGMANVAEIAEHNILGATFLAMRRAVEALPVPPAFALIDGNRLPPLPCPARAIVRGDGLSLSIAAASIVAKVTRDRLMADLAAHYPGYGWERNAGYGTPEHQHALRALGVTPAHRHTFAPIRALLEAA